MQLYLTVCSHDRHGFENCRPVVGSQTQRFERSVSWESAPDKDEIIFVGRDEGGSGSSINARVSLRVFSTDGITIEAVIEYCREEYDGIVESVLRDGFEPKGVTLQI